MMQIRFIDDIRFKMNVDDFQELIAIADEGLDFPLMTSGETLVAFNPLMITLSNKSTKVTVGTHEFMTTLKHALKFYS